MAHEGDGADFGYWPIDIEEDVGEGSILKVNGFGEWPTGYSGDVVVVNDHGNLTIGCVNRGKFKEYYSVV